jgi:hypothetical protein
MSFKTHLIIVSFIILAVYLAWQLMEPASELPAVSPEKPSPYSITIVHASWGVNCRLRMNESSMDNFAKDVRNTPLREDNVLAKISEQCDGKLQCSIPVNSAALGLDPAPECAEKELRVEYRCFSYDRPWEVHISSGTLNIDCNKPQKE